MRGQGWVVAVSLGAALGYPAWSGADELPAPRDARRLTEPVELMIGAQPITAHGFATAFSLEQVRAFYARELAARGWQMGPMPWLADVEERRAEFERNAQRYAKELAEDPKLAEQASRVRQGFAQFGDAAQLFLYAARGGEHVILNLQPEEGQTLVFVGRWAEGPLQQAEDALGAVERPGSLDAPGASCCVGGAVPHDLQALPSSIPRYPNAQRLAASAPGQAEAGSPVAFEMSVTRDRAEQVAEYFRRQMAYNGWSPEPAPPRDATLASLLPGDAGQAGIEAVELLAFRGPQGRCAISIVQGAPEPVPDLSLVPPEHRQQVEEEAASPADAPRTLFTVMFFETTPFQKALQEFGHEASARP